MHDATRAAWGRMARELSGPLKEINRRQADLGNQLEHTRTRTERAAKRLAGFKQRLPKIPVMPDLESVERDYGHVRVAQLRLVFVAAFLILAIAANMGMLSEILVQFEIVPAQDRFPGTNLPLSLVYAAILTIIEVGTGFLFEYASD